MKNSLRKFRYPFAAALLGLFFVATALAQTATPWSQNDSPLPAPTGFVNDYAGVIDPSTKQQLETKLKNLQETTDPSVEIAVAVVKTTGDRPIFEYSLAVARGWKIGSKADDNPSALLFIAIDDRKYFTQVSKDLEDELPDGVVGGLQRQYLVPEFKKGNYSKGISDTVDSYIATIRNKGNTAAPQQTPAAGPIGDGDATPGFGIFCCAGILLLILVIYFAKSNNGGGGPSAKDRSRWGGGGFGGGVANAATGALPWIIGGLLGGGGRSGGSSSSGWGGSSGGGGWGGFGGGGDFGGGGAGGSW